MALVVIIYALVVTILWVTTYYNRTDHYIIAGVIFSAVLLYIITTCYQLRLVVRNPLLVILPGVAVLIFIGLILANIGYISDRVSELFPSLENSMLTTLMATILAHGYLA
jgi:predicted PurR-regulated permease PerM